MTYKTWALMSAGCIGASVAILHGLLMHQLMVKPILARADYPPAIQRLLPVLLQFSTFCWLLGGLALIATPWFSDPSTVVTITVFVSLFYAFGAIGNFWGTRGRHPGWLLLSIALALIVWAYWPVANY